VLSGFSSVAAWRSGLVLGTRSVLFPILAMLCDAGDVASGLGAGRKVALALDSLMTHCWVPEVWEVVGGLRYSWSCPVVCCYSIGACLLTGWVLMDAC
jgi:hypothetical protein